MATKPPTRSIPDRMQVNISYRIHIQWESLRLPTHSPAPAAAAARAFWGALEGANRRNGWNGWNGWKPPLRWFYHFYRYKKWWFYPSQSLKWWGVYHGLPAKTVGLMWTMYWASAASGYTPTNMTGHHFVVSQRTSTPSLKIISIFNHISVCSGIRLHIALVRHSPSMTPQKVWFSIGSVQFFGP